jgi:hypothetical protein
MAIYEATITFKIKENSIDDAKEQAETIGELVVGDGLAKSFKIEDVTGKNPRDDDDTDDDENDNYLDDEDEGY